MGLETADDDDLHFPHGVVGPVGDAEVRGIDHFVAAARFIDHLFGAEPAGATGQGSANVEQFTALVLV